ncbi:hypothetical protein N7478_000679 [Penicillium angulare]|uniref:uncharacterized protein n=1 Tax=Penicillium angulare TaxID=116970 RepID=UPI002541FE76|nr:uncharacterized protein N7478_000679 [Penicillium angulare]KAJ5291428.1 hypothetical protein N7478_000679 [Penicillium angulare]
MSTPGEMSLHHPPWQFMPQQQYLQHPHTSDSIRWPEIEDQFSYNEDTMLSEPVMLLLDGLPDVIEFDKSIIRYIHQLVPESQGEVLINAKTARTIRDVLRDPQNEEIESAGFR